MLRWKIYITEIVGRIQKTLAEKFGRIEANNLL